MFNLRVLFYIGLLFQLSTSTNEKTRHSGHVASLVPQSGDNKAQRGVENVDSLGFRNQTDVIVIGCGAAAVAAMRKLHDAGLNVMGLEAADRIGGRIKVAEFGSGIVNLGAEWVIGEVNNAISELATPYNLLNKSLHRTKYFVLSNGELVPNSTSQNILNAFNDEVKKADKKIILSIIDCVRSGLDSNPVLKSNPKLAKYFVNYYERMKHLGVQDNHKHDKSLRSLEEHWPSKGHLQDWKGTGYMTLFDILLNKYPDPSQEIPLQILLNKEVKSIQWTNNTGNDQLVRVDCKDGSSYSAKSVIVTVSIGVLKERHLEMFNPPLPPNKVTVIDTFKMLVIDKIYVEFDKPWWAETSSSYCIIWTDEDKAKFGTEDKWITEIHSIDTVAYHSNVLLFWIIGNGAASMEKVSVERAHAGVNKLLDEVIRKKFNVSTVKRILRTQWASDALTRGAYAYRSVETEENGGYGAITLSEPLYSVSEFPVVCFAGEATSHHQHWDAHGAVESGFREADRLIESFKRLKT